jgi:glycogen debranching enzyme
MTVNIESENFSPVRRTIKHNDIFLVTDVNGNIISGNDSGYGLYFGDTRFLSRLEFKINGSHPIVLSSSTETGHSSIIIGTNAKLKDNCDPEKTILQETIQIKRESIIYGSYFETITLANYNSFDVGIKLELFFDVDFLDIFEVRNITQIEHPKKEIYSLNKDKLVYSYKDVTGASLDTEISFWNTEFPLPCAIDSDKVTFEFYMPPSSKQEIKYQINLKSTANLQKKSAASDFDDALEKALFDDKGRNKESSAFKSDNEDFNEMIQRAYKDINMLSTKTNYGEYIAAGIPWYTTLFGRDSIITAQQALMLNPNLAKNVLKTLAIFQGKEYNPWRDEEPGKILHEIRFGELARSNQIPHSAYYGTVDATPLWIMLLHDYFKWTDDRETLENLWQNALACLGWMENYAMYNGFACYSQKSERGLENQSWKDSWDSHLHADRSLAEAPIASVEVQGYFYAAMIKMAKMAVFMEDTALAKRLSLKAKEFKKAFHKAFWMEDKQYYAMALDKYGNQLQVISSNAGHLLACDILDPYYANIVADRLFETDLFSGWGVRTLSSDAQYYNPMSYHNGSIWPHDNSIIAYGLAKLGRADLVMKITTALFEAARLMYYKRLPELFCGFTRKFRILDPPVIYPVACNPQAWAAASVFLLIQSMLNIDADAQNNKLKILNASIPDWIDSLKIRNLRIGNSFVDLEFNKTQSGLVIAVPSKRGKLDIIIRK